MKYKYFSETELMCKCGCNQQKMDHDTMQKFVILREMVGPLTVNSAYRCPKHNTAVSTTGATGPHTTGKAIDFASSGRDKYRIMEAAQKLGATRFGIAKGFIHVDFLTKEGGFDEEVIWAY